MGRDNNMRKMTIVGVLSLLLGAGVATAADPTWQFVGKTTDDTTEIHVRIPAATLETLPDGYRLAWTRWVFLTPDSQFPGVVESLMYDLYSCNGSHAMISFMDSDKGGAITKSFYNNVVAKAIETGTTDSLTISWNVVHSGSIMARVEEIVCNK